MGAGTVTVASSKFSALGMPTGRDFRRISRDVTMLEEPLLPAHQMKLRSFDSPKAVMVLGKDISQLNGGLIGRVKTDEEIRSPAEEAARPQCSAQVFCR